MMNRHDEASVLAGNISSAGGDGDGISETVGPPVVGGINVVQALAVPDEPRGS